MGRKQIDLAAPCKQGHTGHRRPGDKACRECLRSRKRADKQSRQQAEAQRKRRRATRARTDADWPYLAAKQLKRHPQPRASYAELAALWASQGGRCGLTGAAIPPGVQPHLDHKTPTARGGSSLPGNLHFVHPMANHAKNSHSEQEFREWLLAAADALRQKIALEALL